MDRIIFFLNQNAGTDSNIDLKDEIARRAEKHQFDYRIVMLEKEIKAFNPSVAVAAGGDGTINLLTGLIYRKHIRLGIIQAGSSNGMAFELNIPENPEEALDAILEGKTKSIDLLKINDRHLCIHMGDLGMNAKVIRRYEKEDQRGLMGYAKQYFRELGNRSKFRFTLETNEGIIQSKAIMIVLANSPYYGTGARIAPEGKPDDGWFEVVVVRAYP